MIRKVVQQVFKAGHLTVETEQQLKQLFQRGCSLEDIDALTDLQHAVMYGHIKRVSRQRWDSCRMNEPVGVG
jgi:hypothetical protein